jgi:hypothetical protein
VSRLGKIILIDDQRTVYDAGRQCGGAELRALVSGQAGLAVVFEEGRAASLRADDSALIARESYEWPYMLADADDVVELNDVSLEEIKSELSLACRKDGALHLILILLDRESSHEGRKQSAACLEEMFSDEAVRRFIENRLFVAPLPISADIEGSLAIARDQDDGRVNGILQNVRRNQDAVRICRRAWDTLPVDLFGSAPYKEEFAFNAVNAGVFHRLSVMQPADRSAALDFEVVGFPNSREIMKRWIREIKAGRARGLG